MKPGNVEAEPKVLYDYSLIHTDQLKHDIHIHVQFNSMHYITTQCTWDQDRFRFLARKHFGQVL